MYRGWPLKVHSPWQVATGSPNFAGSTTSPVSSASSRCCSFAERFARLDSPAGSDPERGFGVLRVFDPEEQDAAGPVDDDHACRTPFEGRAHLPIVTDRNSSRTTGCFRRPLGPQSRLVTFSDRDEQGTAWM